MKVTRYDKPWTHLVVDDFIDDVSFEYLQSNFMELHANSNTGRRTYSLDRLSKDTLEGKILDSSLKIWNEHYHEINHGEDLFNKATHIIYEWRNTLPYDKERRASHRDSEAKLMSVVYYVSPHGSGTTLLEKVKEDEPPMISKTLDWKPNRALVFVRKNENVGGTWHYIKNDIPHNRHSLNLSIFDMREKHKLRKENERNKEK